MYKYIGPQICPEWSCVYHQSGSWLDWLFPRLPMIVVEEEEDKIVTLVCQLRGALSQSHWKNYIRKLECYSGIQLIIVWNSLKLLLYSRVKPLKRLKWAFAWALIGVSVTLLKHGLIKASILTSSSAGVCAVLTLTHQLLPVQRTTGWAQLCS